MDEVSPPLLSKAAVRTQIDTTEANIGRLSSQIQSLASQIQNLTAERENERRSLARLWFMIAPVGTLPTELLPEIFGLSIQTAEAPSRPGYGPKLGLFASSPRLCRLSLWAPPRISFAQHHLPWTQLTYLKFTNSSLTTCLSIFRQCTNLVSVAFTGKDDTQFELEPLIAPRCLKTLSLDSSLEFGPALGPFFTQFKSLPALEILALTFPVLSQPWPASPFSIFQSRAPNITNISLSDCPIGSQELIDLLRLIPALTKLSLLDTMSYFDSVFLRAFSFNGVSTADRLVPQLCELDWRDRIWRDRIEFLDFAPLIAAIRSRCSATLSGAARLRAVTMSAQNVSKIEEMSRSMEDLVAQGLKFEIHPS